MSTLDSMKPRYNSATALAVGRDAASFPAANEDYFHAMDGGIALTPDEVKGRNMWIVWTGGDDRFWNVMTDYTFQGVSQLIGPV